MSRRNINRFTAKFSLIVVSRYLGAEAAPGVLFLDGVFKETHRAVRMGDELVEGASPGDGRHGMKQLPKISCIFPPISGCELEIPIRPPQAL